MWGCNFDGTGFGQGFHGAGIISFVVMAFIIILITVFIIKMVKSDNSPGNIDRKDSLDILKIRYARGEISEQEYKNIKETIST